MDERQRQSSRHPLSRCANFSLEAVRRSGVLRIRHRRFRVVLFSVAAIAAAFATVAWAHHTDNIVPTATYLPSCSPSAICWQDNSTLTYFREASLSANAKTNVFNVLSSKYDPTDLSVSQQNPPSYTGGSETDIIYNLNGSIPGGASAQTVCDDPISSSRCDQFYVQFRDNSTAINNAIACHETGHAVGLTHGAQASPVKANSDQSLECLAIPSPYVLAGHSVPQINATY